MKMKIFPLNLIFNEAIPNRLILDLNIHTLITVHLMIDHFLSYVL